MMGTFYSSNDYRHYLEHHGVKGMKWGIRRYQNPDGTLTAAGRKKAAKAEFKATKKGINEESRDLYDSYLKMVRSGGSINQERKRAIRELKAQRKAGSITRKEYKQGVTTAKEKARASEKQAEVSMAVGQYFLQKAHHLNRATYAEAVKGKNSAAYKRAQALVQRDVEYYGDYTVRRLPDGSFTVQKIQVYAY